MGGYYEKMHEVNELCKGLNYSDVHYIDFTIDTEKIRTYQTNFRYQY